VPVLAAWNNVVVPRLPVGPAWYVVVNSAAGGGLLAAARRSGLSWEDLALTRRRLPAGARWGAGCSSVVAGGYAVALAVPVLRPLLTDARIAGLGGGEIAYQVLVRIPFGTVLWEEVAFRGVLFATLARVASVRAATAGSAALFGLWHIRPTLAALAANDLADGPALRAAAVLGACLATAGAGVLFTRLRLVSGSLLAPVLLHLAANTLGTVAAAAAHRLP
jgi:membrane protease YdiL (CAAX protease family)